MRETREELIAEAKEVARERSEAKIEALFTRAKQSLAEAVEATGKGQGPESDLQEGAAPGKSAGNEEEAEAGSQTGEQSDQGLASVEIEPVEPAKLNTLARVLNKPPLREVKPSDDEESPVIGRSEGRSEGQPVSRQVKAPSPPAGVSAPAQRVSPASRPSAVRAEPRPTSRRQVRPEEEDDADEDRYTFRRRGPRTSFR